MLTMKLRTGIYDEPFPPGSKNPIGVHRSELRRATFLVLEIEERDHTQPLHGWIPGQWVRVLSSVTGEAHGWSPGTSFDRMEVEDCTG